MLTAYMLLSLMLGVPTMAVCGIYMLYCVAVAAKNNHDMNRQAKEYRRQRFEEELFKDRPDLKKVDEMLSKGR